MPCFANRSPLPASRVASALAALATLVACFAATAASAATVDDTIAQRAKACFGCHGPAGAGVPNASFPRLAGQPADYLAAQMRAFRDGVRTYAPMNFLLSRLSDDYLREMAEYFAAQRPDVAVVSARRTATVDAVAFEAGRRLVHEGRAEAGLPACASCHGPALMGREPFIPGLAGLPRDLMVEQVGSWKTGAHRGAQPDCMAEVARRMSGADIVAAATWLSLQTPDGAIAPPDPALPIACGVRR